jgi:hypothetical protein
LCGVRTGVYATTTAVVAHSVVDDRIPPDDTTVDIGIMNNSTVNINHRCIIPENVAGPYATRKSDAEITAAIVDAAVKANARSPITHVIQVNIVIPSPITGSPVQSGIRRGYPNTRYPIIVIQIRVPGPITGFPNITLNGTSRYNIHRYGRRGETRPDAHAHANLGMSCRD